MESELLAHPSSSRRQTILTVHPAQVFKIKYAANLGTGENYLIAAGR